MWCILENLINKKVSEAKVNKRGFIRLAVPVDALSPINKRKAMGIKDDVTEPQKVEDTTKIGDRIRITIIDGKSGKTIKLIDSFQREIVFQGAIYSEGKPLIAIQQGLGHNRNTPIFRRYFSVVQSALSPGDPGSFYRTPGSCY